MVFILGDFPNKNTIGVIFHTSMFACASTYCESVLRLCRFGEKSEKNIRIIFIHSNVEMDIIWSFSDLNMY